jgi:hypothetical protein
MTKLKARVLLALLLATLLALSIVIHATPYQGLVIMDGGKSYPLIIFAADIILGVILIIGGIAAVVGLCLLIAVLVRLSK